MVAGLFLCTARVFPRRWHRSGRCAKNENCNYWFHICWTVQDEEDSLALVFQHVKPEDAGLYTCVAQTTSGKISCSAELTVQGWFLFGQTVLPDFAILAAVNSKITRDKMASLVCFGSLSNWAMDDLAVLEENMSTNRKWPSMLSRPKIRP